MMTEITESKKAVDALKASEEFCRNLFDHANRQEEPYKALLNCSPDPIILYDIEGKVQYLNPAHTKLFGWTLEEAQGKRLNTLPDCDREATLSIISQILTEGAMNQSYETQRLSKQGQLIDVSVNGARFLDHNGNPAGMLVILHDITERKRAENELRQIEARFRSYFELPLIGIAITSVNKDWLEVNSTLCDMLGYSRQELTGMTWTELTHPDDVDADLAQFNRMITGPIDNYSMEKRFIRKDGDIVWTNLSVGCVRKPDGSVDYVVALLQNITLRKKTEVDLRTREERYRQLADVTFEGIIFHDQGVLLRANDQFFKMFGYEPDELVGTQIMEKTLAPESIKTVRAHIAERSTESYVAVGLRKDGTRFPTEIRARMREIDGKTIRATAIRDISMLKSLEDQLIQSQKMEAIGTLAGGFAHDFNNKLQVIAGYVELILYNEELPEKLKHDMDAIGQAVHGSAELIREMLVFSRKTTVKFERLYLNRLVTRLRSMLVPVMPKMITVDLVLAEDLWPISAAQNQIDQILMNLSINARDAMPEGGKLTIQTQNTILDEGFCHFYPGMKPGRYVLLSVMDTGIGMNEQTVKRIFEPFFTTKEKDKGTGLGLSVVYGIVEKHVGKIICDSDPSVGTTFKIYLPAIEEVTGEEHSEKTEPPKGQGETILLVDDEANILEMAMSLLNDANYRVIAASNAKDALELYEKHREEIRLVILDLLMPGMGGKQCLEALRKLNPNVRVLIASGAMNSAIEADLKKIVASGLIAKPFDTPQLLENIRKIID